MDIYEVTVTLLGNLEDIMEITEEQQTPTVGSCFEELAEAAEFDVYIKYVHIASYKNMYMYVLCVCVYNRRKILIDHTVLLDTRETLIAPLVGKF